MYIFFLKDIHVVPNWSFGWEKASNVRTFLKNVLIFLKDVNEVPNFNSGWREASKAFLIK